MDNEDYLVDTDGNLRFTKYGLQNLKPYFLKAGIDIHSIKTELDYLKAREQAAPFFMDWLADRTMTWPDTDDYRLLKSAVFGDDSIEEFQEKVAKHARKKSFRVVK